MKETIEKLIESAKKLDEAERLEDNKHAFWWRKDYTNRSTVSILGAISESLSCSMAEAAMIHWLQCINIKLTNIQNVMCVPQEQKGNINWEDEEDDDDTTSSIDNLND